MSEQIITIIRDQGKSTRLGFSADKSLDNLKFNPAHPVSAVFIKEVTKKLLKNKICRQPSS